MAKIITLPGMMFLLLLMSTILSTVYGNSFLCPGEGSFRKLDSCREYYTCISFQDMLYSRLDVCPDSEIFDDAESKCVLGSHLSRPHDCLQGGQREEDSPVSEGSAEDHVKNFNVFSTENSTENFDRINTGSEADDGGTLHKTTMDAVPQQLDETTKDAVQQQTTVTTKDVVPPQLDETTKDVAPQQLDETTQDVVQQQTYVTTKDVVPPQPDETTKDVVPPQPDETTKDVVPPQPDETTKDVVPQQPNVAVNASMKILSVCDLMNITDAYFTLAIGSPPLRLSLGNHSVYNINVMQYNRDITQAHSNTYLWRRGKSIPQGLRQSHHKANEYKNDFQKKFAIYKEQIQIILSQKASPDLIRRLEDEIKSHFERITRAQERLNTTLVPELRQFLVETIYTNEREIQQKQLQKNPNSELFLLRELVIFVTFVRNDASKVEDLARRVLQNMYKLLEKISIDAHNYAQLDNQANEGIKNLTEQAAEIRQELTRNAKQREELEADRKTIGEKFGDLRIKISKTNEAINKITKDITEFIKIKGILCIPTRMIKAYAGLNVTCDDVLKSLNISFDLEAENARLEELRREIETVYEKQSTALEELSSSTKRMELSGETFPKSRRLEQIEFELYNMQLYATHLQKLKMGVVAARDSILQLLKESQGLHENFESRVKELQEMIDAANTAITDGIVTGTREIIETDLENLLITLQNQKLNNINECFTI